MDESVYNPEHYNIKGKHFWQIYFDRLAAYSKNPHTASITSVKFYNDGKLEIYSSNNSELFKLIKSRFISYEEGNKIVIPSYIKSYKNLSKSLWLFIPQIFDPVENRMICENFIKFIYEKSFPPSWTGSLCQFTIRTKCAKG